MAQRLLEFLHLLLGLVAGHAVALLQLAGEVFGIAFGHLQVVVGQLAPLGLDAAAELFSLALDGVLVHGVYLVWGKGETKRDASPGTDSNRTAVKAVCAAGARRSGHSPWWTMRSPRLRAA